MANKNDSGSPYRSAVTGQYVTEKYAKAHTSTTVKEAPGPHGSSGDHYRSAISGRFVTTKHGKASPNTTIKNS